MRIASEGAASTSRSLAVWIQFWKLPKTPDGEGVIPPPTGAIASGRFVANSFVDSGSAKICGSNPANCIDLKHRMTVASGLGAMMIPDLNFIESFP
jgi:hypothetical protein